MAAVAVILVIILVISFISEIHVLGLWVFMMITHGFLVELFGDSAVHLPMYAGLIIMATTVARGKWTGIRANIWLLMSCLLGLIALAALLGLDPAHSVSRLVLYSKGFMLAMFVGGVIKDDGQIRIVTLYCLAAVLIGDFIAINQYVSGEFSVDAHEIQRAGGLSRDPNNTAMLLLTGVPLALYWFVHSRKLYSKFLFAGVFVLTIGAITLTQSRGGGVALVLILTLVFIKRPTIKAFALGIVLVSAGLLFASADYLGRMESLTTGTDSADSSLETRFHYVETGVGIFLRNPILGVGMGNFGKALVESDSSYDEDDSHRVAHNMYLEFFVENGLFAGMLFLALLVTAVVQSFRHDTRSETENSPYGLGFCFSMSLVAIMIAGLFLSEGSSSVLWFLVGVGLVFHKIIAEDRRYYANRREPVG